MAKFLYVEDDEDCRNIMVEAMRGHFSRDTFVAVATYREAVKALAEQGPFDGIISDFNYPGKDDPRIFNPYGSGGIDLLARVQEQKMQLPFVFMTGRMSTEINEAIVARGIAPPDKVFFKPVDVVDVCKYLKDNFCTENRPEASKQSQPRAMNELK